MKLHIGIFWMKNVAQSKYLGGLYFYYVYLFTHKFETNKGQ